jgi:cell wall-associated NlpC family hydrolase/phage-related protein
VFDAGAIMAHLDIETSMFSRKMDAAEARVKRFEDGKHEVRLSAVFDNASLSRARQIFSQLDQQLSRDAMSRLRSGPQGSVLGALNAMFSPHPVTGAPTAQQAAQQGLLGRIVSAPAAQQPGGANNQGNVVTRVLTGSTAPSNQKITVTQAPGSPTGAQTAAETAADRAATTAMHDSAASQNRASSSMDRASQAQQASAAASRSLFSRLGGIFGGGGGGGGGASFLGGLLAGHAAGGGGSSGGGSFAGNLGNGIGPNILGLNFLSKAGAIGIGGAAGLGAVPALLGGAAPLIPAAAGVGALGALYKGANQQVAPLAQLYQTIQNQQALAVTPAQKKAVAGQQASLNQAVSQLDPAQQAMFKAETQMSDWWQNFTQGFAPQFAKALQQVASLLQSLSGPLTTFFKAAFTLVQPLIGAIGDLAKQWLPLLAQGFQAAAPVIRPLIDGIGSLVTGLLPGLNALIKASAPAVAALAHVFGELGGSLGQMLAIFAPVLVQSAVIFKALFDVIAAIFPIIGKLAAVFATALAPVFTQFAKVVVSLLPFLTTIGNLFAALASAVLQDLVAAFSALAQLLVAISPALNAFAKAFSAAFVVLENTGVFAILGDALEALVKPLATLINALLKGLTPLLPPIIGFISKLSGLLINALVSAITALLPPLTKLATDALAVIAQLLPVILPLLLQLAGIFTTAVVSAISGVATALSAIINAVPVSVLSGIVLGLLGLWGAMKGIALAKDGVSGAMKAIALIPSLSKLQLYADILTQIPVAIGKWILQVPKMVAGFAVQVGGWIATAAAATAAWVAENAATLGIVAGLTLLVAGIIYVATHWSKVWGDIKHWAEDAWRFIYDGIGKYLLPLLGPVGLIALGAIELAKHWSQVVGDIKNWAADLWRWFSTVFGTDLAGFFTKTIPGWWDTAVNFLKTRFVQPVENSLKTAWDWVVNNVGAPINNFFTKTLPGWWDTAINFLRTRFVTPFQNALSGAWNWVKNNVFNPLSNFVTVTIPNAFSTAVTKIGQFWGKVQGIVQAPIKFVVDNVLDGLIRVFDTIANAVGLGKNLIPEVHPFGLKQGGKITQGTHETADDVLVRVSKDETVVSAQHSRELAPLFAQLGIPGYAQGGKVQGNTGATSLPPGRAGPLGAGAPSGPTFGPLQGAISKIGDVAKIAAAIVTGNATAMTNAFGALTGLGTGGAKGVLGQVLTAVPKKLVGSLVSWIMDRAGSGSGNSIVQYAESFIGKVPYLWGGTTTSGWDCSGFTDYVYKHFGYSDIPRTSQAQFSWARKSGPVPGALAFFAGADGTQAQPGHVGIVIDGSRMVDAYATGYGTRIDKMAGSSGQLSGYGIPPTGFKNTAAGAAGGFTGPLGSSVAGWIAASLKRAGLPANWALDMAVLVNKESGGRPNAINKATAGASGEHAEGIAQTIPSTFAQYSLGGSIWNPVDDLVAAERYIHAVYGSPANIPGLVSGNYVGYKDGGPINEPILGFGTRTGTRVMLGEAGNEYVVPGGGDKLDRIASLLSRLIDTTASVPHGIGGQLGMALSGVASDASFRNRYPRGGA